MSTQHRLLFAASLTGVASLCGSLWMVRATTMAAGETPVLAEAQADAESQTSQPPVEGKQAGKPEQKPELRPQPQMLAKPDERPMGPPVPRPSALGVGVPGVGGPGVGVPGVGGPGQTQGGNFFSPPPGRPPGPPMGPPGHDPRGVPGQPPVGQPGHPPGAPFFGQPRVQPGGSHPKMAPGHPASSLHGPGIQGPGGGPGVGPMARGVDWQELQRSDPELFEMERLDIELERKTFELVGQYRRTPPAERAALAMAVQEAVAKHFEVRQKKRQLQLARMERELKRMREEIQRRDEAKEQIVGRRLKELIGESGDLDF